jgi:hypothetical protein
MSLFLQEKQRKRENFPSIQRRSKTRKKPFMASLGTPFYQGKLVYFLFFIGKIEISRKNGIPKLNLVVKIQILLLEMSTGLRPSLTRSPQTMVRP